MPAQSEQAELQIIQFIVPQYDGSHAFYAMPPAHAPVLEFIQEHFAMILADPEDGLSIGEGVVSPGEIAQHIVALGLNEGLVLTNSKSIKMADVCRT